MDSCKHVCQEILAIMNCYREQEASDYGVSTPGGLEHMGDVWRLFRKWEGLLLQPAEPPVDREQVRREARQRALEDVGETFSNGRAYAYRYILDELKKLEQEGLEPSAEPRRLADSGGEE